MTDGIARLEISHVRIAGASTCAYHSSDHYDRIDGQGNEKNDEQDGRSENSLEKKHRSNENHTAICRLFLAL